MRILVLRPRAFGPAGLAVIEIIPQSVAPANAAGQRNLGLMYLEGRGVPQDLAEAARWLKLPQKAAR